MAIRATMVDIVDRVEALLRDESNAIWSAQTIADELDRHRLRLNYERCAGEATYPSGVETYLTFIAPYGDLETDAALYDRAYSSLSTSTDDYEHGRFTVASEPALRPVLIVAWAYDLRGCAASLINQYLADWAGNYDFSADGGSYSRSQAFAMYERLRDSYANTALGFGANANGVRVAEMIRGDVLI